MFKMKKNKISYFQVWREPRLPLVRYFFRPTNLAPSLPTSVIQISPMTYFQRFLFITWKSFSLAGTLLTRGQTSATWSPVVATNETGEKKETGEQVSLKTTQTGCVCVCVFCCCCKLHMMPMMIKIVKLVLFIFLSQNDKSRNLEIVFVDNLFSHIQNEINSFRNLWCSD